MYLSSAEVNRLIHLEKTCNGGAGLEKYAHNQECSSTDAVLLMASGYTPEQIAANTKLTHAVIQFLGDLSVVGTVRDFKEADTVIEGKTVNIESGSMIAANQGEVSLLAGKDLNIRGSDVVAANRITGTAQNINIIPVDNLYTAKNEFKSQSSGLTIALSGAVGELANNAMQSIQQADAAEERGSDRVADAHRIKGALNTAQSMQGIYQSMTDQSAANQSQQGSMIGIAISVGATRARNTSATQESTAQGNLIAAGNRLSLTATGDGSKDAEGHAQTGSLNVGGSKLSAKHTELAAARDLNLYGAQNTRLDSGSNSSSGWRGGVKIGVSQGSVAISVFADANSASGRMNGTGTTHTESLISGTDSLTLSSGRDTNLVGAQARGQQVNVNVGRNLTLASQQDSSQYHGVNAHLKLHHLEHPKVHHFTTGF